MKKLLKNKIVIAAYFLVVSYLPVYIIARVMNSLLEEGGSDMADGFFILASMVYSPVIVSISMVILFVMHRKYLTKISKEPNIYLYGLIGSLISFIYLMFLAFR